MRSKQQGYLVLATGPVEYTEMAINLAASIRVMDPLRPVCLVHDAGAAITPEMRQVFDDFAEMDGDGRFPNVMNKLRLFDLSPYAATMAVDADCLMVKHDIDRYWAAAAQRPFSITGDKRRGGRWKGIAVRRAPDMVGAPYLIHMNAGIFYFDRSPEAAAFARDFRNFYLEQMERLNITNYKGPNTHSFELYLGLFMGLRGMDTENIRQEDGNSWMVTLWRSVHCDFDPANDVSVVYKLGGNLAGITVLPTGVTRLSPTFAHFVKLKPRGVYGRLAAGFRAQALAR